MTYITIRNDTFVCHIYDVGNFMWLPLANVRKLWKIMFAAGHENKETIEDIQEWLPHNIEKTKLYVQEKQEMLMAVAKETENVRRTVAAFGCVATKEQRAELATARRKLKAAESVAKDAAAIHTKSQKLQTLFNKLYSK